MDSGTASRIAFLGVSTLIFTASTAVTIAWSASMSAMADMAMCGGLAMSMAWIRMPGQSWAAAAFSFIVMWAVMMVAMMLPALFPALLRYRQAAGRSGAEWPGLLAAVAGAGYFLIWTLFGIVAYPLGATLAAAGMQVPAIAQAIPAATGVVVLIAGALQFTGWKEHHLACLRAEPGKGRTSRPGAGAAWRHGLRLGTHCVHCSFGAMLVLLVAGVMDLRVMAAVAAAMTAERLAPAGEPVAKAIGVIAIGSGILMIAQAVNLV